jgi:hypothetical protein
VEQEEEGNDEAKDTSENVCRGDEECSLIRHIFSGEHCGH